MERLRLDHVTLQDDKLIHQVRFTTRNNVTVVSCNCRLRPGEHEKAGKLTAEPIGPTNSLDESRRLYNDPVNHWAPFTKEDEAKW